MRDSKWKCPECGRIMDKRGKGSHKGSVRCAVERKRQQLEKDGWRALTGREKTLVEENFPDAPLEVYPYKPHWQSCGSNFDVRFWTKKEYYDKLDEVKKKHLHGYTYMKEKQNVKKVGETMNYIAVDHEEKYKWTDIDNSKGLLVFRKDEPGMLQRWKFLYDDEQLYTLEGKRVGKETDEVPDDMEEEVVAKMI